MSCDSDLESLAMLIKDRHTEMLAFVGRERQLKQSRSGQAHKRSAWQWLRRSLWHGLQPESRLDPSSSPRSLLQN